MLHFRFQCASTLPSPPEFANELLIVASALKPGPHSLSYLFVSSSTGTFYTSNINNELIICRLEI